MRSVYEVYIEDRPATGDQRPATSDRPTDDRPTSHLANIGEISNGHLREGSSDPFHVWFYFGVFEVGESNGVNSGLSKCNRYVEENNARGVIRLVTI